MNISSFTRGVVSWNLSFKLSWHFTNLQWQTDNFLALPKILHHIIHLIFRPNWGPRGWKIFFGDRPPRVFQGLDQPLPCMRFLLFIPLIKNTLLKMWLKFQRSSLQLMNLNLQRMKQKENWPFWVSPFSITIWRVYLLSGGRTKDLVRKTYFGILSTTIVLKLNLSTECFCKSKKHFLYAMYTKN